MSFLAEIFLDEQVRARSHVLGFLTKAELAKLLCVSKQCRELAMRCPDAYLPICPGYDAFCKATQNSLLLNPMTMRSFLGGLKGTDSFSLGSVRLSQFFSVFLTPDRRFDPRGMKLFQLSPTQFACCEGNAFLLFQFVSSKLNILQFYTHR